MSGERVAQREAGEGWVSFIGVLFALLGAFNALDGIVALAGDAQFREENLFFGDLTFWGLTLLGIGALQLLTAVLILRRNANGQGLGIILCAFNLIWQLFFVAVFPIWSLLIIAADVLIIYGLCIHDRHFKQLIDSEPARAWGTAGPSRSRTQEAKRPQRKAASGP